MVSALACGLSVSALTGDLALHSWDRNYSHGATLHPDSDCSKDGDRYPPDKSLSSE